MAGCLNESDIRKLIAGSMSPSSVDEARRHVNQCPDCRSRVAVVRVMGERNPFTSTTSPGDNPISRTSEQRAEDAPLSAEMLPSIEGYDIISRIHSGAQGIVYKAVQKSTSRTVAVKLLPHEHAATDRQKHRFEREVGLAASLRHPNIVTVYDSGLTSGRYFFAMEYIHGKPLNEHLAAMSLTVPEKMRLFAKICAAIGYAHQKGVIHRDLKPGNILVDSSGEPHVVDFGLAKSAGIIAMHRDAPFTLTSQFMGTLAYASPEQTKGDPALIDMRSDIYSLGVILFEMLTGTYPYPSSTDLVKMFHTICTTPPKTPSSAAADMDADVDTITLRALAKEPERRYQSVQDMQQDVERWLAGEPISARRDSLPYLMRLKGRRFLQRRRASTVMVMVVLASVAATWLAKGLFTLWPWPINAYEHAVTHTLSLKPPTSTGATDDATSPVIGVAGPVAGGMEQVRIIAITDDTPGKVSAMAQQEGFTDVSKENWKSLRRLHGRLMERLARSGVRAVVWDIKFVDAQPFNEDFIKGVKTLQSVGVNPVIGVERWNVDAETPPELAPDILAQGVGWGGVTLGTDTLAPWRADLVVQRGDSTRLIGLPLAALGAMRHPMMWPTAHLDPAKESVQLQYLPAGPGSELLPQSLVLAATETVNLSSIRTCARPTSEDIGAGLRAGDVIGQRVFLLPDDATYQRVTVSYHDVFAADDAQLRQWFDGMLVLIGDLRSPPVNEDWHATPDGRVLAGPQGHAAAIDSLLRSAIMIRYPGMTGYLCMVVAGAVLGLLVAMLGWRGLPWRTCALAAAVFAVAVICVASYQFFGYLHNPFSPVLALLLAFAGGLLIHPIHPFGMEADSHRRSAT